MVVGYHRRLIGRWFGFGYEGARLKMLSQAQTQRMLKIQYQDLTRGLYQLMIDSVDKFLAIFFGAAADMDEEPGVNDEVKEVEDDDEDDDDSFEEDDDEDPVDDDDELRICLLQGCKELAE